MTWRLEIFESLPSTSTLCRQRAEAGEGAGLAILARQQSAGQGSRGRSWSGGAGNLAFSFLLGMPSPMEQDGRSFLQCLPYLVAVALHETFTLLALRKNIGAQELFQLKWPNDLLLQGHKMAGILIETGQRLPSSEQHAGSGEHWACIGIGANLAQAPEVPGRVLGCAAEIGLEVGPEECASLILAQVDAWCSRWRCEGSQFLLQAWLARAHPVGTRLAVKSQDTYISGRFSGLDAQGRLLHEGDDGTLRSVVTGEVLCL
ncbi:biotin--[acetyl-CoA-carboxylase] ligase [Oecophyllibacter saccharovorans]|uniref:biotin--[biotin carboxyl-carrier protein] ligase n=1 Tax=Oecophyllibacter saccharovorans TaxID=2558360 RepID=A0A506UQX9_9PROT|nr:biotin--[acetyl-CoA-carboxylase] ligase [Oecophyllibacter saccharovorans]TPW35756.1 biotin--[acetyl-CoA-carboxylase] ligase [Oecophyllibacter saccharovorans]